MAYRGRGRGRGGYGYQRYVKEEKYEVFPEIKELPDVNLKEKEEIKYLVAWSNDLEKFWKSSPYRIEDMSQGNGSIIRRPPLSDYMMLTGEYVPSELVAKNVRRSKKRVRWDPQSDLQKLDVFEKLDQVPEGEDDGDKEKKEDEDEDEDNENIEEEEDDSGDDYEQNIDFDDDEDDFNMPDDGGDDEGYY